MLQAWCEGYGPMRVFLWLALLIVISAPTFADDIDLDKLARPERDQLARCTAIRLSKRPVDFEKQAESAARSALNNDFGDVQSRQSAGGLDRKMDDAIGNMLVGSRQAVVVLYGDDLRKVQPERKSCRPKMCGASPCVSLDESSEYECVINQ